MNRRSFIESLLGSAAVAGLGGASALFSGVASAQTSAGFSPINRRILVNTLLDGAPDMRHLIVPRPSNTPNTYGYEYWSHRSKVHRISNNFSAWMTRFNDDYFPVTVGGQNWNSNILDQGSLNAGLSFGIWREAGWLIDQFLKGNAALAFNVAGSSSRAHDRGKDQINSGFSDFNSQGSISGWGGRLARRANGNVISVTDSPTLFCFGPQGSSNNFNPLQVDNSHLLSVPNSRQYGLNEFGAPSNQRNIGHRRIARALNKYYDNLRTQSSRAPLDTYRSHESMLRSFGDLLETKLSTVPTPDVITALGDDISINGQAVNPASNGNARRVLRSTNLAQQISNTFDALAANDVLDSSVISLQLKGFDTHARQRDGVVNRNGVTTEGPDLDQLRVALNDPGRNRRLESLLKDLFGGPFVDEPNALKSGFAALQAGLAEAGAQGRQNIVYCFNGEFGRQLRENGDNGTDHGAGNLMLVIGDSVRGGLYGDVFPDGEIAKYGNTRLNTPDIETLTNTDHLFGAISNWVVPNSARAVFPKLNLNAEDAPKLESGISYQNLFG